MRLGWRFLKWILPKHLTDKMEAESKQWMIRCPEGHQISAWDAGAIRYGGRGNKQIYSLCRQCGQKRWMAYVKDESPK